MVRVGPITEKEKYFVCTFAGLECLFFVKHFPFLNDFEFDLNLTMLSPSMRIKKKTATNLVCLKGLASYCKAETTFTFHFSTINA